MTHFFLSCEHGGNFIPEQYTSLFKGAKADVNSHKGIDYGTLDLFREVKPFFHYSNSDSHCRLLVELNRSLHHPRLFSTYSKRLSLEEKKDILEQIYHPYRKGFSSEMEKVIGSKNHVVHVSLHSFTPVLDGEVRNCDIGLLYDPCNLKEKEVAKFLKKFLVEKGYQVRYNYPYKGKADGFTTYLRKSFPKNYAGLELEINQKFAQDNIFNKVLKLDIKKALEYLTSGLF